MKAHKHNPKKLTPTQLALAMAKVPPHSSAAPERRKITLPTPEWQAKFLADLRAERDAEAEGVANNEGHHP